MNKIKSLEEAKIESVGIEKRYCFNINVDVEKGSFLHVGGSPNPLTGKKAPIFMINEIPAIPATSFKGALRHATELYIQTHLSDLKKIFNLENTDYLIPCLPTSNPTDAEKSLTEKSLKNYRPQNCRLNNIDFPQDGLCPVCYLFGANGLMGFLRFNNLLAMTPGQKRMEQTNIRIDRKLNTAARHAIVSGDQVLPGTKFEGKLEIVLKDENCEFGKPRAIGDKIVDLWLNKVKKEDIEDVRMKIINNLIIEPLSNIDRLGGQKSRGGGKVKISLT